MKRSWLVSVTLATICLTTILPAHACFSVVVGKEASTDGSVLFGHNEDDRGQRVVNVWLVPRKKHQPGETVKLLGGGEIPQLEETWGYLWFQMNEFRFADYFLNEWGVAIASNRCSSREDQAELSEGGISFFLRRIVAERARTAGQGVEIAGQLLNQFGYDSNGRTLVICDSNEGWLLSMVAGKHWVAQRVPDDGVVVMPNAYVIREVDFDDPANFITSKDNVREYAIRRGWCDSGSAKPFDFAYSFMAVPTTGSLFLERGYDTRQWRGQQLITGKAVSKREARGKGLPFAVKPNRKLSVADVIAILRDHYEGTEYAPARELSISINLAEHDTQGRALPQRVLINPNFSSERTICTYTTQHSTVAQLRRSMPKEIGTVLWVSFGRPDCNAYVPWYLGMNQISPGYHNTPGITDPVAALEHHFTPVPGTFDYDPQAAFWIFNDLENLVDLNYYEAIEEVQEIWKSFEQRAFSRQEKVESTVLGLWESDPNKARRLLTEYTNSLSDEVVRMTKELTRELKSSLYH